MHSGGSDLKESKWYNCRVDSEPEALDDPVAAELIRDLCPALFEGHNDLMAPLCCNKEQILILNEDLKKAEALIGNCPSCYFNFRNMWCHMTCSPNQADFVIAKTTVIRPIHNYTNLIMKEEELKRKNNEESIAEDTEETEETEESNNTEKREEETHKTGEEEKDSVMGEVVTELSYFINENFVKKLIESCK